MYRSTRNRAGEVRTLRSSTWAVGPGRARATNTKRAVASCCFGESAAQLAADPSIVAEALVVRAVWFVWFVAGVLTLPHPTSATASPAPKNDMSLRVRTPYIRTKSRRITTRR